MDMLSESLTGHKKAQAAAARLSGVLSLNERLNKLDPETACVYTTLLTSFIQHGHGLTNKEIAVLSKNPAISTLRLQQHGLVNFDSNKEPVEACPFTTSETPFNIIANGHHTYATSALDALAIAAVFSQFVKIKSVCHVTDALVYILQLGREIMNHDDVRDIYFGINWSNSDNSATSKDNLRSEMIFLKGNDVAEDWRTMDYESRQIFSLEEAISFSAEFYLPLQSLIEPVDQPQQTPDA